MDDVKPEIASTPQAESEPAEQPTQAEEQTPETPEVSPEIDAVQERTVPLTALQEERKKRQELQRQLAERERAQQMSQYDPEDIEQVLQHPLVQELILKDAKRELTDYAREATDQYPSLHPQVKKAILRNARGFVNETTTDLESAKIDLLEYIEELAADSGAEQVQAPQKQTFQVAATNVPTSQATGAKPADVQNILNKPMDEWTDEEAQVVDAYSKKSLK